MADGGQIMRFKLDSNEILLYIILTYCVMRSSAITLELSTSIPWAAPVFPLIIYVKPGG